MGILSNRLFPGAFRKADWADFSVPGRESKRSAPNLGENAVIVAYKRELRGPGAPPYPQTILFVGGGGDIIAAEGAAVVVIGCYRTKPQQANAPSHVVLAVSSLSSVEKS